MVPEISMHWVGVALGLGIGLWYSFAPSAALKFYKVFFDKVGLRFPELLGPDFLRALGVFSLTLGLMFLALALGVV